MMEIVCLPRVFTLVKTNSLKKLSTILVKNFQLKKSQIKSK